MIQRDDIDAAKLAFIAVVGAVLVLLTGILVKVLFHHIEGQLFMQHNLPPARALVQYRTEQQEKLHHYSWVDRDKQVVAIPIEQAMTLTVKELQAAHQKTQVPN